MLDLSISGTLVFPFIHFRERNFYKEHVTDYCYQLLYNGRVERIIEEKLKTRDDDWFKNLQKHREFELIQMRKSFQHENFLSAMKTFVYHKKGEIHETYHFKEEKH